jgi:hypothetical protein
LIEKPASALAFFLWLKTEEMVEGAAFPQEEPHITALKRHSNRKMP